MRLTPCPSCQSDIKLGNRPHMGQQIRCRNCDAPLEVVWLNPVELDWVEDEEDAYRYARRLEHEFEHRKVEDLEEIEEEVDF